MKQLTKIYDLTSDDIHSLLALASGFRAAHQRGVRRDDVLGGKVVAMIFEKPSLRTKIAFEVATTYLGGTPVFLTSNQILASGNNERGRESVPDIARNLERFADLIAARVYDHGVIEELATSMSKPLINLLCDGHHPTQALADLLAIDLNVATGGRVKVAYVGDGNNVATSLLQACTLVGHDVSVATPEGFEINRGQWAAAESAAAKSGSTLSACTTPAEAVANADVVYTDTFVSMGQETEKLARLEQFRGYQVDAALMAKAKPSAKFMHCLPAHRGEEVTDEVIDSAQSIVFEQAECRLHIAKALISTLLDALPTER